MTLKTGTFHQVSIAILGRIIETALEEHHGYAKKRILKALHTSSNEFIFVVDEATWTDDEIDSNLRSGGDILLINIKRQAGINRIETALRKAFENRKQEATISNVPLQRAGIVVFTIVPSRLRQTR